MLLFLVFCVHSSRAPGVHPNNLHELNATNINTNIQYAQP